MKLVVFATDSANNLDTTPGDGARVSDGNAGDCAG